MRSVTDDQQMNLNAEPQEGNPGRHSTQARQVLVPPALPPLPRPTSEGTHRHRDSARRAAPAARAGVA